MSNEAITLNVTPRLKPRKGDNRKLRDQKLVPAVVYGTKLESTTLIVDELSAIKYSTRKYENAIFNFKSDDKTLDNLSVLMKDLHVHPVTRRPLHVDFFAVDMTATVKVSVEVKYDGKAKGVTEEGGMLQVVLRDIEVECLPKDIPSELIADISNLGLNEGLHISDLKLPDGVKTTSTNDLSLVNIVTQKEEKEEEAVAETTDAPAAEATTEADKK